MTETTRRGLSRERIVEAALGVVARDGLDALSMRRLAQELDVWPMSVYRYFRDKDELLDAVVDGATDDVVRVPTAGSWREQIVELLRQARAALGAETGGLGPRFTRAMLTPGAMRVSEAGVRILRDAGLEPDEAAQAWRALCGYVFGFAAFDDGAPPGESERRARSALAALPPDEYPALTEAAGGFATALAGPEQLEYGLERMLDGLQLRLDASRD
ncbi:MAG TPA: TetR/AcrR family transcriptional regulator [Thermoleophilaceae bacterium]|nr:TetR/AcrR family transcriptional regulator [Thermoleophilaceae bacterium]